MRARTVWGVVWILVGLGLSIGGMVLATEEPTSALVGEIGFGVGILPLALGIFMLQHAGSPWRELFH